MILTANKLNCGIWSEDIPKEVRGTRDPSQGLLYLKKSEKSDNMLWSTWRKFVLMRKGFKLWREPK